MDLKQLAAFGILAIVCLGTLSFSLIGYIAFKQTQKGAAKSFGLMFQRGNFFRILTVVIVVVSAALLGLAGVISENGIISILSGVAGYVLGGLEKPGKESDETDKSGEAI